MQNDDLVQPVQQYKQMGPLVTFKRTTLPQGLAFYDLMFASEMAM